MMKGVAMNNDEKVFILLRRILFAVFIAVSLFLSWTQLAHCQDRQSLSDSGPACAESCNAFLAPVYCRGETPAWTALKASGYIATAFDVQSTNSALRRGAVERSNIDRIFFDARLPNNGRYALAMLEQYGYNALLDLGWRKARSKKEKALLILTRSALTGLSIYLKFRNDALMKR
jgi:hypothetical protein